MKERSILSSDAMVRAITLAGIMLALAMILASLILAWSILHAPRCCCCCQANKSAHTTASVFASPSPTIPPGAGNPWTVQTAATPAAPATRAPERAQFAPAPASYYDPTDDLQHHDKHDGPVSRHWLPPNITFGLVPVAASTVAHASSVAPTVQVDGPGGAAVWMIGGLALIALLRRVAA